MYNSFLAKIKRNKMRLKLKLFIYLLLFLLSFSLFSQSAKDILSDISSMSLEEKAYQVMMINISTSKKTLSSIEKEFSKGIPGAILLFKQNLEQDPRAMRESIESIKCSFRAIAEEKKLKNISPLIALDNEGGSVFRTSSLTTYLPSARKMASQFSVAEAESLFYLVAQQMKMLGIDFNLAPVAECATDINSTFLADRTFSSSMKLTVEFANAFVRAMNKAAILCSIKHFPGNGNEDPHGASPTLRCSRQEFDAVYLLPFKKIIDEGHPLLSILLSHVTFPVIEKVPFSLSKKGVNRLVRKDLGFSSLVLTDDIAMAALKNNVSSSDNAILALEAGVDMIMCSERRVGYIIDAIVKKAMSDKEFEKRLNEAVFNIIKVKNDIMVMESKNGGNVSFDEKLFYELKQKGDAIVKTVE